ncbi:MAG: phosphodiester glycosidase family protein [Verrucomicrobiales bacterium]
MSEIVSAKQDCGRWYQSMPRKILLLAAAFCLAMVGPLVAGPFSVTLPPDAGGNSIRVEGFSFDDRTLSFLVVDEGSLTAPRHGGLDPAMRQAGAIAGINGGFFSPEGAPLGRMVADGVVTGRLARGSLTSGVIFRDDRGLFLWRVAEYEAKGSPVARQMLQAGPFLIDARAKVPGLEATKSRPRSFVAHDGKHAWVIATAGSCTLAGLSEALSRAGTLDGVGLVRALNLDGGSSTGLWMQGKVMRRPWAKVRNYLAVVPK